MFLVEREGLGFRRDLEPEAVLAAGRDLRDDQRAGSAAIRLEEGHGEVLRPAASWAIDVRATRVAILFAGDELDQIAPVRPDVRERARRAAQLGIDPPVVVLGAEQPILEVSAVDQPRASSRLPEPGARLPHGRVIAVDKGNGDHRRRRAGGSEQFICAARVERDRLLADDVPARRERREAERNMQVVRGADVDDVDIVGGDQLLGAAVGPFGAELPAGLRGTLRGRRGHRDDLRTGKAGRPRVDSPDEPAADDPDAQSAVTGGRWGHGGTRPTSRSGRRRRPSRLGRSDGFPHQLRDRVAGPVSRVLSSSQLATLAEHGEERTAEAGETLFEVGDASYPFIAILEGEVAVTDAAGQRDRPPRRLRASSAR